MTATSTRLNLAREPDFMVGKLAVSPSTCRVTYAGADQHVEAQTMSVLLVLARADGATVSRDGLLEACWQGRIVSDDAITRTIAKVRSLVRDIDPAPFVLETLPKVGYRLVAHEDAQPEAVSTGHTSTAAIAPADASLRWWQRRGIRALAGVGVVVLSVSAASALLPRKPETPAVASSVLPSAPEVAEALILLDETRVRSYLDRGWLPNWNLDSEGNNALQILFMACERNPTHNRGMVAKIARMLVVAGVDTTTKNKWGDTALDIASSPRYCGPNHPVVDFLKSMTPAPTPAN